MNLWHARLADHDGRVVVEAGRQRLVVPAEVLFDRDGVQERVGEHLILGLRPEAFALAGPRDAGPIVELPVTGVEDLGSHQLVHLGAEGAGMQLANASDAIRAGVRVDLEDDATAVFTRPTATLVARLPSHARVRPGERLRLSVDFDRVHFFDPDTQRALR